MTLEAAVYTEVATLLPDDLAEVFEQHPFLLERFETYAAMRKHIERMADAGTDQGRKR